MTALDSIAPLRFEGLKPAVSGREPQVVWLSIRDLRIDRAYQRGLGEASRSLIRRMAEGWDWALCGPVTVAEIDGGLYELIDGQHRATAAATAGLHRLPAVIVEARDTAQRARVFQQLNSARVDMYQGAMFRASLAAGDAASVTIARCAAAAGARIVTNNRPAEQCVPGDTLAIAALKRLLNAHGEAVLTAVLRAGTAAQVVPIRASHLAVLAEMATAEEWGLDGLDPDLLGDALDDAELWKAADCAATEANMPKVRARAAAVFRAAAPAFAAEGAA